MPDASYEMQYKFSYRPWTEMWWTR